MEGKFPELTIEEIRKFWPNEWVLIEVTRVENHQAVAGRVIEHSPDEGVLIRREQNFHRHHSSTETFLFWTGAVIPEGVYIQL